MLTLLRKEIEATIPHALGQPYPSTPLHVLTQCKAVLLGRGFKPIFLMTTSEPNIQTASAESQSSESAIASEQVEKATAVTYAEEIETVIASMAVDQKVMVGQSEAGGHLWKFKYGSVEVFVQLTGETEDDTFTVWAFVLQLPAKNEAQLMRKILEMNWLSTLESHFAIVDNQVAVVSTRTIAEISAGEISRVITIVATIADDNDDLLQAEFGQ